MLECGGRNSSVSRMGKSLEQIVPVALGDRSYDIVIQHGLIAEVGERLAKLAQSRKVGVVTDRDVARQYLPETLQSLRGAGFEPAPIILAPGERTKTF